MARVDTVEPGRGVIETAGPPVWPGALPITSWLIERSLEP